MKIKAITKQWLQKQSASIDDIMLWETIKISDPMTGLKWLIRKKMYRQGSCLIVQMMSKEQYCQYANYATEQAIRKAMKVYHDPSWVDWAEEWLSGKDRSSRAADAAASRAADAAASRAAGDASRAAAAASRAAGASMAADAASRAADAAASRAAMRLKILRYGMKILSVGREDL